MRLYELPHFRIALAESCWPWLPLWMNAGNLRQTECWRHCCICCDEICAVAVFRKVFRLCCVTECRLADCPFWLEKGMLLPTVFDSSVRLELEGKKIAAVAFNVGCPCGFNWWSQMLERCFLWQVRQRLFDRHDDTRWFPRQLKHKRFCLTFSVQKRQLLSCIH